MCGCLLRIPHRHLARHPDTGPDPESNQRPFGSQAGTQSTEPHQPGLMFAFQLELLAESLNKAYWWINNSLSLFSSEDKGRLLPPTRIPGILNYRRAHVEAGDRGHLPRRTSRARWGVPTQP